MPERHSSILSPRAILGLFLIIAGIFFTLDNLDILNAQNYWKLWPLALVAVGLGRMLQPGGTDRKGFSILLVFLGIFLLLDSYDLLPVDIGDLAPLLLVLLGVHLIRKASRLRRAAGAGDLDPSDSILMFGFLSGIKRSSNSKAFRGAEMTAVMGGCELDLTRADIPDGVAVIDTFTFWGGIEIKVPREWTVDVRALPVLGGYDDATTPPEGGPEKRLVIKGMSVMGGVEIKN